MQYDFVPPPNIEPFKLYYRKEKAMRVCNRSVIYLRSVMLVTFIVLLDGCMKTSCYECTTTYPVIINDTVKMSDSTQLYCDVTIEKIRLIESLGTFEHLYVIKGEQRSIQTVTDCK